MMNESEKIFEAVKEAPKDVLSEEEIKNIAARGDLRRREQKFKTGILILEQPQIESIKETYDRKKRLVFREASGELDPTLKEKPKEALLKESDDLIQKAKNEEDLFPELAAFCYAEAAKLRQISEENFSEPFERAKSLAKKAKDSPKTKPSDFLTDSVIIGVNKREIQKTELPEPDKLKDAVLSDKKLLRDYSLCLEEEQRERFLALLPQERRKEISAIMDEELSNLLKENLLESKTEKTQADAVKRRVEETIKEILNEPELYLKPILIKPSLVKTLTNTLANLESEDGKRLLLDLGKAGLPAEKDKRKERQKISYVARILETLSSIDIDKGGNLAIKFLAKKEVPSRLFKFFCERLIKNEYLTDKTEIYLKDEQNLPFLKKLIAEYPNQFNTVVDTISQIKDYNVSKNQEEIFSAIQDLDSLTPIIFNRYRLADAAGKKELIRQLKELKPKFFRNIPIKDILPKKDRDILAEMVYLAYKPVNMSFEKTQALINKIEDKTEDIENYVFPEQGYDFNLATEQVIVLKEGASIDIQKLRMYKDLLKVSYPENKESIKQFSLLLNRLAKAGTDVKPKELSLLLSIVSRDEFIINFLKKFESVNEANTYNYLNELKEILGIYFKDNYGERLNNFLGANPTVEGQLMKILSNTDRRKVLQKKLGRTAEQIDWKKIIDKKEIADVLTLFIGNLVLKGIKENINKDVNKFITQEGKKTAILPKNLKAYLSKNIGSFFAKASAGICTAEDISLFERGDHFHINVVENDEYVKANIQAYIIDDRGKKSLVLRGFNPNTDFLDQIDAQSFSEKVIEIARKFQKDNNLLEIYITEQGSWHALSNREKVADYLLKKYVKDKNKVNYSLQVASSTSVSNIFKI